jgi:hypothetical protein
MARTGASSRDGASRDGYDRNPNGHQGPASTTLRAGPITWEQPISRTLTRTVMPGVTMHMRRSTVRGMIALIISPPSSSMLASPLGSRHRNTPALSSAMVCGRWFGRMRKQAAHLSASSPKSCPVAHFSRSIACSRVIAQRAGTCSPLSVRNATVSGSNLDIPWVSILSCLSIGETRTPRAWRGVACCCHASGQAGSMFGTMSSKNGSGSSSTRPFRMRWTRKTLLWSMPVLRIGHLPSSSSSCT